MPGRHQFTHPFNTYLFNKRVAPYYLFPDDLVLKDQESFLKWVKSECFKDDLNLLLAHGWRPRVVGATVVGALRLEKYIDRLVEIANGRCEFRSAGCIAFALLRIGSPDALEGLRAIVEVHKNERFIDTNRKIFNAALSMADSGFELVGDHEDEISRLSERLNNWKDFNETL